MIHRCGRGFRPRSCQEIPCAARKKRYLTPLFFCCSERRWAMTIVCNRCGVSTASGTIRVGTAFDRCRSCGNVFDVRPQVQRAGTQVTPPTRVRRLVPQPAAISVTELPDNHEPGYRDMRSPSGELLIRRTWRSPTAYFMILFCAFWDGFLINWYRTPGLPLTHTVFPLLHVGVGVYF